MKLRSFAAIAGVVLFLSCPFTAQVQGTWNTTGLIHTPLYDNVQVVLANGKALSAGGTDGANFFAAAQLYNPTTGTWTATGSLTTARAEFAAVVLHDGKVLVEGGFSSGTTLLASAELYDPSKGKWSPAGNLSVARYGHTATLLQNGEVLVTGGCMAAYCTSFTAVAEIYHPTTNGWTTVASLKTPRYSHAATLLNNGNVLVVGGANTTALRSTEVYDPNKNTWSNGPTSASYRYLCTATLLSNGKALIAGGFAPYYAYNTAELYDPTTNTLTATGNLKQGRFSHSATLLPNNTVLIAGGQSTRPCHWRPCAYIINTAETYDIVSGVFSSTGKLNQARAYLTTSLLNSGQSLTTGGLGSSGALNTAELYVPLTLAISQLSAFGLEQIGATSAMQTVKVTNVTRSSVKFTSIAASGDFHESNNCGASLAAGANCSISVTFKPTAAGTRTGAITLKDNSLGSPVQTVALTGTGEQYAISFTPNPLNFPPTLPGQNSTMSATVTNDGASSVNITKIAITPADKTFRVYSTNCPSTLGVQQTCQIVVEFTPPDSIMFTETLQIFDNAKGSPHTLTLTGTGTD